MISLKRYALALCIALAACLSAEAVGWPANYKGVMLQGFYWDSYKTETKWTKLEDKADEYSKYFSLIWVPNSGKSSGGLGYMPIYWFTNHNSSMGSEAELRSMIAKYKEKNVGIIADLVINHRVGKSNWTDFPAETWNGKTWQIGKDGICRSDEVNKSGNPGGATGANDTGEDFDGARDLDHTNANVQENCKNYAKCLLENYGYAGFRLDMVKGYAGKYTKMYNQYAKPRFCVGEYWDGSYDALAAWIEATGRESAAFDFAFKYAVNEAFSSGDMTKLAWAAGGDANNMQPAGLIHFGYQQLAVTFIDNHDTCRDDWNKFPNSSKIPAANAFMICSPGTPCVFLPHWNSYSSQIAKMINIRNSCGVTNTSSVKVLKCQRDCYMAEVTGSKGKLVVKVGSSMEGPSGYTASDIKASGTDYCIYTKVAVVDGGGGNTDPTPDPTKTVTLYWDNSVAKWTTPYVHYWGGDESTWPGVKMSKYKDNVWQYTCPAGTTGCLFNAGDGDATKTEDFVAIDGHVYTQAGDQGKYSGGGDTPTPGIYPSKLYLCGNVNGGAWSTLEKDCVAAAPSNGVYTYNNITIDDAGDGIGYFTFITACGADWNEDVNGSDRYGAASEDEAVTPGTPATIKIFPVNVSASSAYSWSIAHGIYKLEADLAKMKLTVTAISGVEDVFGDESGAPVEYFNLMGMPVANPTSGVYIVRRGSSVKKVLVK